MHLKKISLVSQLLGKVNSGNRLSIQEKEKQDRSGWPDVKGT